MRCLQQASQLTGSDEGGILPVRPCDDHRLAV
jgi:hypothetical protein